MRKYHEKLSESWLAGESKICGNYSVIVKDENISFFTYFGNIICTVSRFQKIFTVDACGYENYSSTTAAINGWVKFFKDRGFTMTNEMEA